MSEHAAAPHRRAAPVMGTVASIHVHDAVAADQIERAVTAVVAELRRLEAVFSTFRPDSQVSRVNRGEVSLLDCDVEVLDVLDACTWLEHESGGVFRARRPGSGLLDPAGFVKGWAAERAAQELHRAGLRHWYVSVGGDLLVRGTPAPGEPWRVAIADPAQPGSVRAWLEVHEGAVATSGAAERGDHVWDGRTGEAAGDDLASVTVLGPHLTWADAFATTAFAMGSGGLDWVARFDGYSAVGVARDGTLRTTGPVARASAA